MRNGKKALKKFTARQNVKKHKRKANPKDELKRLAQEVNVGTAYAKFKSVSDTGRADMRRSAPRRELFGEGIFSETQYGYGFVKLDGGERDIFIPKEYVATALDGDRVEIAYHYFRASFGEEKSEGRILGVTDFGRELISGTVSEEVAFIRGRREIRLRLIPDENRFGREIYLEDGEAEDGDKVLAKILRKKIFKHHMLCSVVDNFGSSMSKEANYMAILTECGIETEFSDEELTQAHLAAAEPVLDDGRVRITDTLFTIDSESAKDLDDAVSLRKAKDGYELSVHIADVSHYVEERCALERLAFRRGCSVYFTDKVVPMLPQDLSNGACSLNPGEDKYALSATMTLSADGEILDTKIEKTVIRSELKGIYSEINQIFEGSAPKEILKKYEKVIPTLEEMRELYEILEKKSRRRGAMNLESAEAQILLDEDGMPKEILKRERGVSEKLIEQFMLTANEGVATLLSKSGIPCVFRIHDAPPPEKREEFVNYAHSLGFNTEIISNEKATAKDYSALLTAAEEAGLSLAVSYTMLRSMAKAEYSDIRRGHFGLGIEYYCHFTSPIRRLSDLATHRIIHASLLGEKTNGGYRGYAKRAAAAATEAELRAVSAERRIENLYKTLYMSDKIGEEFSGFINSITQFGMFVMTENTCEGLVPISSLSPAFTYDEKNITLRSAERVYRIGEPVRVKLEEADISRGKLRFSIIDSQ